jgi:hypothetical protein
MVSVYRFSASPEFIIGFVSGLDYRGFVDIVNYLVKRFCSVDEYVNYSCVSMRFYDIVLVFARSREVLDEAKSIVVYMVSTGFYDLDWDQCSSLVSGDFNAVLSRFGFPLPPSVNHPVESCFVAEKIIEFFKVFGWYANI